jgi:hypothetical protein
MVHISLIYWMEGLTAVSDYISYNIQTVYINQAMNYGMQYTKQGQDIHTGKTS